MGWDSVSRFMGSKSANTANNDAPKKPCEDAVASGDVPVAILTNRIMAATDEAVKAKLEKQLSEELEVMFAQSRGRECLTIAHCKP